MAKFAYDYSRSIYRHDSACWNLWSLYPQRSWRASIADQQWQTITTSHASDLSNLLAQFAGYIPGVISTNISATVDLNTLMIDPNKRVRRLMLAKTQLWQWWSFQLHLTSVLQKFIDIQRVFDTGDIYIQHNGAYRNDLQRRNYSCLWHLP